MIGWPMSGFSDMGDLEPSWRTLSYTYFPTGKVETIIASNPDGSPHPNGVSVAYTYDDLNRLETVVETHEPHWRVSKRSVPS